MKNYVQAGDIVTIPAPAAISSGAGIVVGTLFGVATRDAESGADMDIATTGVFDLVKVGSQAWTVGAAIYWDAANARCTTVSTSNTLIGKCVLAVGSGAGETTGRVLLG